MIEIGKPNTIRRWFRLESANENQLMWIAQRNVDLLDLEWTDDEQEQLKSLAD
jgi:hypothetical protein